MLVDSDAFVLLGASGLIKSVGDIFGLELADIRRLFPLPLMLDKGKLARKYPPDIREKAKSWCSVVEPLREAPSDPTRQRLVGRTGIDDGEEILFGLAFENQGFLLLTGDKRALRTLCSDPELRDITQSLRGRVACVESVLKALLHRLGIGSLSGAVAPMRPHNGMLNAVFSSGTATSAQHCLQGLSSYIEHLQSELGPGFLLDL